MKDGLEYWCRDCKAKDHQQRSAKRAEIDLCHCGRSRRKGHKTCWRCIRKVREWNRDHPQEKKANAKAWRDALRAKVYDHYGRKCVCPFGCEVTEEGFLTMDHIHGGGCKQAKENGGCGHILYAWLVKHNFPEGFRTLCYNCNCGRAHNGGICPHQQKKETHHEK